MPKPHTVIAGTKIYPLYIAYTLPQSKVTIAIKRRHTCVNFMILLFPKLTNVKQIFRLAHSSPIADNRYLLKVKLDPSREQAALKDLDCHIYLSWFALDHL